MQLPPIEIDAALSPDRLTREERAAINLERIKRVSDPRRFSGEGRINEALLAEVLEAKRKAARVLEEDQA